MELWGEKKLDSSLGSPHPSHMTLGKKLNFSEPHCPHLLGTMTNTTQRIVSGTH